MKKTLMALATLVLAAGFVSCQKDELEPTSGKKATEVTGNCEITAVFAKTKVSYSETGEMNLQPSWETADVVFGFDDEGNTYTFTVYSISEERATLRGDAPENVSLHLIHAKGYTAENLSDKTLNVSYVGQKGDKSMPAVMVSDGEIKDGAGEFTFSNAGAVLGIDSANGVPSGAVITKVSVSGEKLSSGTVTLSDSALSLAADEDALGTITASGMSATVGGDGTLSTPILVAMPAGAKVATVKLTAEVGGETKVYGYTTVSETTEAKDVEANAYLYITDQEFTEIPNCLCLTNLTNEAGKVNIKRWIDVEEEGGYKGEYPVAHFEYSTDGLTWKTFEYETEGIDIEPNGSVWFRAAEGGNTGASFRVSYPNPEDPEDPYYDRVNSSFMSTVDISARGNVMSLLDATMAKTDLEDPDNANAFGFLFCFCDKLKDITDIQLPAKKLSEECYGVMFAGTGLTSIPSDLLPATELAEDCYEAMFAFSQVSSIPEGLLHATELKSYCYGAMFSNCRRLSSIPSSLLPASVLKPQCYDSMFLDCTSLKSIPAGLFANVEKLAHCSCEDMFSGCTNLANLPSILFSEDAVMGEESCWSMFEGCTNLVNVPSDLLPCQNLADYCYWGMFSDCTSLENAPDLPAVKVAHDCYEAMFNGCSKLNYVRCLATDFSEASGSFGLEEVAETGTFVRARGTGDVYYPGNNGIPSTWTVIEDGTDGSFFLTNLSETAGHVGVFMQLGTVPDVSLRYSDDCKTWKDVVIGTPIDIMPHGSIYFKAGTKGNKALAKVTDDSVLSTTFASDVDFAAGGNIMSLLDASMAKRELDETNACAFYGLFLMISQLKDISELILPASKLSDSCYTGMFAGTGIQSVPEALLPATKLAKDCYASMFAGCTNLKNVANLPAQELAEGCYNSMYLNCSSLDNIYNFIIKADKLAKECCKMMFYGCSNLKSVNGGLLPATTLAEACYQGMFKYCTSLTRTPDLPASSIDEDCKDCYKDMFFGCSSLNFVKCFAMTSTIERWCDGWLEGVKSEGTFYKKFGSSLFAPGLNGIPSTWQVYVWNY